MAATTPMVLPTFAKAAPRKGGRLRVGMAGASVSHVLDPALSEDYYTTTLLYGFCNYLTEINNRGELVGELAESFEAKKGAKKWVFRLRKDIEFHNGKSLEAEDVLLTIQHHRGTNSRSVDKNLLKQIENIQIDNSALL